MCLCGAFLSALSLSNPASATQLIYEPFDYTAGEPIAGQKNIAADATWEEAGRQGPILHQVIAGSLTRSGVPASKGNAGMVTNSDGLEFDRIALPRTYGTNTTLYYSTLLNVPSVSGLTVGNSNLNANNDPLMMFNNFAGATTIEPTNWAGELVIRLGSTPGTYNLGIRASNTPTNTNPGHTYWSGNLNTGDTHFIVVRYVQGNDASLGSDDLNSMWIDPDPATFGASEADAPAPDGSSQGTINANSPQFNVAASLAIGAGIAPGNAPSQTNIDEIRVGETWVDVTTVPEPASMGAVIVVSTLLMQRRRDAARVDD
jgi:hypothetical protein